MKLLALLAGSAVVVLLVASPPSRRRIAVVSLSCRRRVARRRTGTSCGRYWRLNGRLSFAYTKLCSDLCAIIILYKIVILTVSKLTRGFPYY